MNATKSKLIFHLIAIATVAIWGTTFVSTKILIQHGLTPSEIFFYRFVLAYICMWSISRKKLFANRIKDELLLFLAGLCGGTIYFLTENTALGITLASNVSLIVCTSPILTTFLSYLFKRKEPFTRHLLYGSFMALIGVGLVVFNGSFILKINPLGDFLSLTAALMWAFYCLYYSKSLLLWNNDHITCLSISSVTLGYFLDATTCRLGESIILGYHCFHALFHLLECLRQRTGCRAKYQLHLYSSIGNITYLSHNYRRKDYCNSIIRLFSYIMWRIFGRKKNIFYI